MANLLESIPGVGPCIPLFIAYGYDIVLDMGYLIGNVIGICFGALMGAPLGTMDASMEVTQVGSSLG